jgi:uncharacterized protein (DUF2252 family)
MREMVPWKDAKQYGASLRAQSSRSELAKLSRRKFDPMDVLREAAKNRLARLLPIKFRLMSDSPFVFFRGSVEIMATDLGEAKHTKIEVQICGDAHVKNFGFFATPSSEIVLDINDFDETQRGPWEWDVKRLATSIILAGHVAGDSESCCKEATRVFLSEYCRWMHTFAEMPAIEVARHRAMRNLHDPVMRSALKKAERSSPPANLKKLAHKKQGGGYSLIYKPGSIWDVKGAESKAVERALKDYRNTLAPDRQMLFDRYTLVDVGFKVVGTGSVGTRDYIVLLLGRDGGEKDPLFLQIKEEPPSAYARYYKDRSSPGHQGQRAVEGQRALQIFSDLLLGWCSIGGRDYLVRQLNDHKSGIEPEDLKGERLIEYGRVCAELLAKGHARSGDPAVLAGYLGHGNKAEKALFEFALAYAGQVEADYQVFLKAMKRGFLRDAVKMADHPGIFRSSF